MEVFTHTHIYKYKCIYECTNVFGCFWLLWWLRLRRRRRAWLHGATMGGRRCRRRRRPPSDLQPRDALARTWLVTGRLADRQRQHDSAERGKQRKECTTKRKNASDAATLMSCKTRVFIMLLKGSQCCCCLQGRNWLRGAQRPFDMPKNTSVTAATGVHP